jgi:hypothetical protein
MTSAPSSRREFLVPSIAWGVASLLLYTVLFLWQDAIMSFFIRGSWHVFVLVATAFAFSIVHGVFTDKFWKLLGIRPRMPARQEPADD